MTSGKANQKVVTDRLDFVIRLIAWIKANPHCIDTTI